MRQSIASTNSAEELALIARSFASATDACDVRALLRYLNGLTIHRFTGVYRFEPGWVVSVALWDRLSPDVTLGADVKMKESYCWLTGLGLATYAIEDATADPRLVGHAARGEVRSYVAVVLRDRVGKPWGTLCHFDVAPLPALPETIAHLERFRPVIEELLVRDTPGHWDPDAPSTMRDGAVRVS